MAALKNKPEYVLLWLGRGGQRPTGKARASAFWHRVVPQVDQTRCGIAIEYVHAATTAPDPDLICLNCEKGKSRRTR